MAQQGNEYLIPIGIDFKSQGGFTEIISSMEKLEAAGGEVGRTIDEGLSKGAKAAQDFDKSVKSSGKNLEAMREAGKVLGKELSDAFKKGDTSEIEKKVSQLQTKLSSITAKVDVDIPDDKIRIFEKQLETATDGVDLLRIGISQMKSVMADLDPDSEEFQAFASAVELAETSMNEFQREVVEVAESGKSMKSQLRAITNELNALEDSGQTNTARFRELQVEAGKLKDQIGDTAAQVNILASDTKHIDAMIDGVTGLVGAFTAVQGAVGLLAGENEELQEALLKVNSAMAVLQGIQAVQNTLNKDSAFNVVVLSKAKATMTTITNGLAAALGIETAATTGATVATKAFGFALKAIGIGLIITAIALLVEYWDELTEAVDDFLPSGQSVGKIFNQIKSYAFGVGNAILQFVIAPIKALYTILETGDISKAMGQFAGGLNASGNFAKAYHEQNTRNAKAEQLKQKQIRLDQWKDNIEIQEKEGKDVTETRRKWYQNQLALDKLNKKDTKELAKEYSLFEAGVRGENRKKAEADAKQRNADAKKAAEEARKQAEEDRKQQLENEKKINEQLVKFSEELEDAKIRNIQDSRERQRSELEDSFQDRIDAVKNEIALSKEAEGRKAELLIQIAKEREARLKEFDDATAKEKAQLQLDANKQLASLREEGFEKDLELLELTAKETEDAIREKYKNEGDLMLTLTEANERNRAEKEKEIRDKYAQQALKDQEERGLLSVELMAANGVQSEQTELQKQIALNQIKLEFANKNLALLLENGEEENSLVVLRAKKMVNDAREAVNQAIEANDNRGFDLMEFLGIGEGLNAKDKKALQGAINESIQILGEFTEFMIDNYDQQIDKKQDVIDQYDDELDDLEDRLEDEKQLQEDGFANNVELIEAEIAEKQRQKDEEVRQQQELLEKKKQMQKAQIAMDSVTQLSGLITSAVNIFQGFSTIPIVGIPLAIAMIGLMMGTFVASKVKAVQAVNAQKFRHGGEIGGPRHESGGVKYYSEDGKNIELEGGEFVIQREKRKKYGRLLDAMNDGNFAGLTTSDKEVVSLFNDLGFDIDVSGATKNGTQLQVSLAALGYSWREGVTLEEINQNIRALLKIEKETPRSWTQGNNNFVKLGSTVIKTKITPIKDVNDEGKESI